MNIRVAKNTPKVKNVDFPHSLRFLGYYRWYGNGEWRMGKTNIFDFWRILGHPNEHIAEIHLTIMLPLMLKKVKRILKFDKSDDKVIQCTECKFKLSLENEIQIHKTEKHLYVCQFINSVAKQIHLLYLSLALSRVDVNCLQYFRQDSPTDFQIRKSR